MITEKSLPQQAPKGAYWDTKRIESVILMFPSRRINSRVVVRERDMLKDHRVMETELKGCIKKSDLPDF